ncbi:MULTISPECIES: NAD(P)-dependent alcohol dehydrogenase [Rathayibacter]|uniref:NAD(P)-dependent alcohol dehydrogenase n=1 Tax=Rathayibacter TaxID=33886 RepID=UPI001FB410F7|nr:MULTISPECIES: NAD(P)-dependent alcohol dehydrogenase [Rathayibacter]MCJ1688406.1 NAD(P)-dependent alcohol dehydrogenase [Rathayibacter sp. VKM Ac-2927]MCJ1697747.1 NAD(P)-dependent alcohol dehydrogenase [Rathayibacter caricis]
MKITAAVARATGEPLSVEILELDDLRHNEVRVRLVATGICHTDSLVRDGIYPTPLPAVLGHEGSGVVEAIGDSVTSVVPGDHVVLAAAYCGHCRRCRRGEMAYCENLFAADFGGRRLDGSTSLTGENGEAVSSHFFGQSSFATYANVVEESVVKVDENVPLEHLGPLGCGFNTGAGTVLNELQPEIGSSLAVFGVGAVGNAAIMAARVADCAVVVAIDVHDSRLELARELGATHIINSASENVAERLAEITGGVGIDYVVDTTGRPELLRQAADAIAVRGTIALVGAARPGTEVTFEIGASLVRGWTFKTVVQGSSVPQDFIPRMIQLWQEGRFPFEKMVEEYSLAEINQGFADSKSGATVKPVIVF